MASIKLSWAANATLDNVTGYEVWGANGTSVAFGSCALLWTGDALSWTDTGLPSNQARTYYLRAVNAVGPSSPEGPVNETTADLSTDYVRSSAIDIDGTLAANSDAKIASQKAVKTYVDDAVTGVGGGGGALYPALIHAAFGGL